jgi:hypothetical protein
MTGRKLITGLRRSQGYQGSAAGLRRSHQGVNGVLTSTLCIVPGAIGAVLGKGAGYG